MLQSIWSNLQWSPGLGQQGLKLDPPRLLGQLALLQNFSQVEGEGGRALRSASSLAVTWATE